MSDEWDVKITEFQLESLLRNFPIEAIEKFYKDPINKQKFEEWKTKKSSNRYSLQASC